MGRYSFEKKAKYRKEAVHTGKVTKKKNAPNIDLKGIFASGEVVAQDVAFKKDQHIAYNKLPGVNKKQEPIDMQVDKQYNTSNAFHHLFLFLSFKV